MIIHLVCYRDNVYILCANKFHMPNICTLFGCRSLIVTYLLLDKIEYCEPQQNKCIVYFLFRHVTWH